MILTQKIIITDTNIISDLNNAKILDKFIMLDNVYISDMVLNDEINNKTGNVDLIKKFKVITSTPEQLIKMNEVSIKKKKLSIYDSINYVIAKENNYILATGDNNLRKYALSNNVEVIRTLMIIKLMKEKEVITTKESIDACNLLLIHNQTRIPEIHIKDLIKEFEKDPVQN